MQTKTTTVSKIEVAKRKDGSAVQGKGWSLWNVWDSENVKYGVFESVLGKVQVGDNVNIAFDVEKNGNYTNRNISQISKVGENVPTKPQISVKTPKTANSCDCDTRLKRLEDAVFSNEIKTGDLPF